jgi:hypothetical protein
MTDARKLASERLRLCSDTSILAGLLATGSPPSRHKRPPTCSTRFWPSEPRSLPQSRRVRTSRQARE